MKRRTLVRFALATFAMGIVLLATRPTAATELTKEEMAALFNGSGVSLTLDDKDADKPIIGIDIFPKGNNADGALAKLKVCKKVRKVSIASKADVSDKGLECLKDMTEVEELKIAGSKYTEKGLANLAGMTKLTKLELAVPDNGEGLAFLKECKDLKSLTLTGTKITDKGFANLKGLKSLEQLEVKFTSLDDAGMANLAGLTSLKKLNVVNTKITGASVATIKKLTGLEELYASEPGKPIGKKAPLNKAGLDDKATDEIKKALPSLKTFQRF